MATPKFGVYFFWNKNTPTREAIKMVLEIGTSFV